jgi:hypothetical protein
VMICTGLMCFRIGKIYGPNCEQGTTDDPYRFLSLFADSEDGFRYKFRNLASQFTCDNFSLLMNTETIIYAVRFTVNYTGHE